MAKSRRGGMRRRFCWGGATILAGITIGKYAMIGAGSVVTKDVPPFELWMGNPARFVKRVEKWKE